MKEYISRADLMQKLTAADAQKSFREMDGAEAYAKFVELVNEAPAADVVERVRGEWDDNIIGFCNVCTKCGVIVERTAIKNKSGKLNFCPNCGRDMRKDEA